jgi:hypothetical protein
VGIGGTISHVTTEYGKNISSSKLTTQNKEFPSELNHRLIRLISSVLIPELKDFIKMLDKVNYIYNINII